MAETGWSVFMNSSFQGLNLGLDFDENIPHNMISELCGEFLLVPDALCLLMADTKPLSPSQYSWI